MIGAMRYISIRQKQRFVDKCVKERNLYQSKESIGINIGALSKYCEEHNLDTKELSQEIISKFRTKK